ncbi:MAG: AAA family ATPase, partial [Gammaproteobacteria bacterium]|nr:AAA family ATPase [Gammaproteobacteria bacterium]
MQDGESPIEGLQRELQVLLEQQVTNNKQLTEARHKLEVLNEQLQALEKRRQDVIEQVESLRDKLQQAKLDFQTLDVRRATYAEQIAEMNYELPTLLSELPAEAKLDVWEQELQTVMDRIQRLGAINLAAIDEHKVQEERKIYLDAQYADLVEALNTLEDAIKKIDKETKQKFQETFDQVNAGFAHLFPKVFGGGSARLELIGDGILDNGIAVMAQPPGKRNTSIHLLSGGEKALTAISLVFSIFQLNPAPFCLLDEVDAPLDDSNVGRFCNLVKEMSNKVQFIFISHNKLAIEMGEQLTGVTMHEPGVSRIVAVDVAEAVAMATA